MRAENYLLGSSSLQTFFTEISNFHLLLNLPLQIVRVRCKNEFPFKLSVRMLCFQQNGFINGFSKLYAVLMNFVFVRFRVRDVCLLGKPVIVSFDFSSVFDFQQLPRPHNRHRKLVFDGTAVRVSANVNRESPVRNLEAFQIDQVVYVLDDVWVFVQNYDDAFPLAPPFYVGWIFYNDYVSADQSWQVFHDFAWLSNHGILKVNPCSLRGCVYYASEIVVSLSEPGVKCGVRS